jgi:hypothetical protein
MTLSPLDVTPECNSAGMKIFAESKLGRPVEFA